MAASRSTRPTRSQPARSLVRRRLRRCPAAGPRHDAQPAGVADDHPLRTLAGRLGSCAPQSQGSRGPGILGDHWLRLVHRLRDLDGSRAWHPGRKLRDVPHWRDSDAFTEVERLVLEYAEAMSATPPAVTDDLVADLRQHLDDDQLVELTMIAVENQRSRFNSALGLTSQGFTDRSAELNLDGFSGADASLSSTSSPTTAPAAAMRPG